MLILCYITANYKLGVCMNKNHQLSIHLHGNNRTNPKPMNLALRPRILVGRASVSDFPSMPQHPCLCHGSDRILAMLRGLWHGQRERKEVKGFRSNRALSSSILPALANPQMVCSLQADFTASIFFIGHSFFLPASHLCWTFEMRRQSHLSQFFVVNLCSSFIFTGYITC